MAKKKSLLVVITITLIMCISLSGCGSDNKANDGAGGNDSSITSTAIDSENNGEQLTDDKNASAINGTQNENAGTLGESTVESNNKTDAAETDKDMQSGTGENEENINYSDNPAYAAFDGALFIGDSRTEGLQLYAGIKNADFFCAKGITIDKINDGETVYFAGGKKLSVYDVLDSKEYTRVYIGLGMNELGMKYIDEFVKEYNELIATVKEKQPNAAIYIQSLIPVTKEKSDSHEYVNNSQIYWYNTHIVEIANDNGVLYVNADAPLVDENGALKSESTTDGVHMNKEYCIKWANEIAEITK